MASVDPSGLRSIRRSAWIFLLGSGLMGAAAAVPWTLLQLYLDRRGFSKASIGGVQSAEAWGQVMIALPAAFLLARRRTPPLLVLSCLLTASFYAALPWLGSALPMQVVKIAIGGAWWVHHLAIAPFLYRHSNAAERPLLFGLAEAVHTGAGVIACLASGRLADALAATLGDEARAMAWVLTGAAALPLLAALAYATLREGAPPVAPEVRILPEVVRHRGLLLRFALPQLTIGLGAGLCIPFLGLYFQDRFDRPPGTVGELYAGWQALATVGFLMSPWIVRRLGYVKGMVAVEWASIPFFLLLAFTHHYGLAVVAFLLRGALMNASGPMLKAFMMEASPDGTREVQVAVNTMAWGVAWVVGPWLGGLILDVSGDRYELLMCTTVGFYLLGSLATILLLGPLDARRR